MASVWQHPFVDVIKLVNVHDGDKISTDKVDVTGNAKSVMDKAIGRRVLRLTGSVAASNCIMMPSASKRKGPTSLGLTGSYIYVQLRAMPPKLFTLHLDILTLDSNAPATRFTFSNMFRTARRKGNVVQIPLGSVGNKWTVLAVDMPSLVSKFAAPGSSKSAKYWCLKSVQLCSNLLVRNVFTSDNVYTASGTAALPRAVAFPLLGDQDWDTLYDWEWRPAAPPKATTEANHIARLVPPPSPSIASRAQRFIGGFRNGRRTGDKGGRRHFGLSPSKLGDGEGVSSAHALERATHVLQERGKVAKPANATTSVACEVKSNLPKTIERRRVPLAACRENRLQAITASKSTRPRQVPCSSDLENQLLRERQAVLNEARGIMERAGVAVANTAPVANSLAVGTEPASKPGSTREATMPSHISREFRAEEERILAGHVLRPDPIMELKALVGYSGGVSEGGGSNASLLWSADGGWVVFPSANNIVVMRPPYTTEEGASFPAEQRIFFGHTSSVCVLAFNRDGSLLCSGQEGKSPVLRIWDFASGRCIALIAAHSYGLSSIDFSEDDRQLCAVGRDSHNRVQILIWDISKVSRGGKFSIVAKQTSEFEIRRVRFSPYDPNHLVSCGRENIRFWRIRNAHLPGCPVILNEYARQTNFLDLAFESGYGPRPTSGGPEKHVFVATELGTVVQVNYDTRKLACVYRLHDGPIHCLAINEGFCVTGSDDCFLRVWPLDFSDYFLEAKHEGAIGSVDISPDGLKIAIGTINGTVGLLDVTSHSHSTIQRAHTAGINALAFDPKRPEFATVSQDGSIRVWSLGSCEQLYEFNAPGDCCQCIAYHPHEQAIACGFRSGCVRIFDVCGTAMKYEYVQHQDAVLQVAFTPDGSKLFSGGLDGNLVVYDIPRGYQPVRMVASDFPSERVGLAVSPDGSMLASIGPDGACIVFYDATTLVPVAKLQQPRPISTVSRFGAGASAASERSNGFGVDASFVLVDFSPDSQELIVATADHRIARYRLERTGRGDKLRPVLHREVHSVHREDIRSISVSPNASYLLTSSDDRLIKVWDYSMLAAQTYQTFIGHSDTVNAARFSPDGKHAVSVGSGNSILVWRFLGSTEATTRLPTPTDTSISITASKVDALSEDCVADDCEMQENRNGSIVAGSDNAKFSVNEQTLPWSHKLQPVHESKLVDVKSSALELRSVLGFSTSAHPGMVWHPSTGFFGFASGRTVVVEDLATRAQRYLHHHKSQITIVVLSSDGTRIATASEPITADADLGSKLGLSSIAEIHILQLGPEQINTSILLAGHEKGVQAMSFSPDCTRLASIGNHADGNIIIWDVVRGKKLSSAKLCVPTHDILWASTTCVVATEMGGITFWMCSATDAVLSKDTHALQSFLPSANLSAPKTTNLVAVSAAPSWVAKAHDLPSVVAVGDDEGKISILGISSTSNSRKSVQQLAHWRATTGEITTLSWCGKILIVGSASGSVVSWEVGERYPGRNSNGQKSRPHDPKRVFEHFQGPIVAMQWDPTGAEGIVASGNGTMHFVRMDKEVAVPLAHGHTAPITDIAFSEDGNVFLTCGSTDSSLRIWSASTLEQACNFMSGPESIPLCARFVPIDAANQNVCACVVGYSDGKLRLFDVAALEVESRILLHKSPITALAFVHGGSCIITGSAVGEVFMTMLHQSTSSTTLGFGRSAPLNAGKHGYLGSSIDSIASSPFCPSTFLLTDEHNRLSVWNLPSTDASTAELLSGYVPGDVQLNDGTIASEPEKNRTYPELCLAKFSPVDPNCILLTANGGSSSHLVFYNFKEHTETKSIVFPAPICELELRKSHSSTQVLLGTPDGAVWTIDYAASSINDSRTKIDSTAHMSPIAAIVVSPNTKTVVTAANSELYCWSTSS